MHNILKDNFNFDNMFDENTYSLSDRDLKSKPQKKHFNPRDVERERKVLKQQKGSFFIKLMH